VTFDEATRASIISAGLKLFHEASIAEVMVDDIVREAGITKKVFYKFFQKKDDFIVECYRVYAREILVVYQNVLQECTGIRARIMAIFEVIERVARSPEFIGCGLMRAGATIGRRVDHPLRLVVSHFKKTIEHSFELMLDEEGFEDPTRIARDLVLILDGALANVMYHRDAGYARDGARLALQVIDVARKPKGCRTPAACPA